MKLGLALEGGAIRAVFVAGVADGLLKLGVRADVVVGVSAGIANGVSYCSNQPRRNLEVLEKYINDERYMGASNALNPLNDCYFNLSFIYDKIPNHLVPFDYEAFAAYPGRVVAVASNLETGRADYLDVPRDDRTFQVLRASCSMPVMFPIVHIDGRPYLDGGVTDAIPWRYLLEQGCDKLIVAVSRERCYVKHNERTLAVARRKYREYPNFCEALRERAERYNESRAGLMELEKAGKALVFVPYNTEGFSRMEKNVDKIRALYQSGYDQVLARRDEVLAYLSEHPKQI